MVVLKSTRETRARKLSYKSKRNNNMCNYLIRPMKRWNLALQLELAISPTGVYIKTGRQITSNSPWAFNSVQGPHC